MVSTRCVLLLAIAAGACAQTLPGTQPLAIEGDPAQQMIDGIAAYLLRATEASIEQRRPDRERLKTIIGAVDRRLEFTALELVASTEAPAKIAAAPLYSVYAVRWPALDGLSAEGLWFRPAGAARARVVVLADAGEQPEDSRTAQTLAASGCEVLAPVLLDRNDTWSGSPKFRMTNQPHREFIYRMAFPLGRHVIGYEVEKVLAAVDWFSRQREKVPIGVWGYGEGGLIALHAAAVDPRIDAAVVSGYFQPRQELWKEPIYRNVWSLLRDFGDAEIARLVSPRTLIIETRPGPVAAGPSLADPKRSGAAPGALAPASIDAVRREFERARTPGDRMQLAGEAMEPFLRALGLAAARDGGAVKALARVDQFARMHRQFRGMVEYTQKLVQESEAVRDERWRSAKAVRERVWTEMIGRLPPPALPLNPRTRLSYRGASWDGYEVTLDLWPGVFAYGVLLLPRDLRAGERRPVVVVQHGLEGRAQFLFGQPEMDRDARGYTNFHFYQNIGSRLAEMGFVVYSPQNPYIGAFRRIQRLANPLGLSMFSFIVSQNERLLEWLATLPFVDAGRIGFYGLSYGGKTALRIPALLEGYALSICSGDFNEWVRKLTAMDKGYSYMLTGEWEMPEWDLAHIASHAELAKLMAPRPFMVERGHRDGVGEDEWVAYEYAKVKRFYDEMGIGDRTRIEYFNGPHRIHGRGTVEFLKQFLLERNW